MTNDEAQVANDQPQAPIWPDEILRALAIMDRPAADLTAWRHEGYMLILCWTDGSKSRVQRDTGVPANREPRTSNSKEA